jgi:hypothetical protein
MWSYCPELMYMPFLMFRKKYFTDKVGGGGLMVDIGIVQDTMITDGAITVVIPLGIEEYLTIGEIVIETICGVVVLGIIITFAMVIFVGIGGVVIGALIMDGDIPAGSLVGILVGSPVDILAGSLAGSPAGSPAVGILVGNPAVDILAVDTLAVSLACSNQM